jgi:hypothetical protein
VSTPQIETDYLIVGAGAMSMAFADVIFSEQRDANMVIVDRRHRPGGHWTDAYPYVALHQPAAFYGVNSMRLGQGGTDLASGAEIVAYYHLLMKRFVESGRVRFLPMTEHAGDGRVVSTVDRTHVTEVRARRRIVDGAFMNVEVPSVTPPRYEIEPGVTLVPPNRLPLVASSWERYVVVGAGKTATRSCSCWTPASPRSGSAGSRRTTPGSGAAKRCSRASRSRSSCVMSTACCRPRRWTTSSCTWNAPAACAASTRR